MVRSRPTVPEGHGELLAEPPVGAWGDLASDNSERLGDSQTEICGVPLGALRRSARRELVAAAREFTTRLGIEVPEGPDVPFPLVVTGHQPELFGPGVWIKHFLCDRFARETGGTAIDLVVDSDGFDSVELVAPCLRPEVRRCAVRLSDGGPDACYACAPVPSREAVETFCERGDALLAGLPSPAIGAHFRSFCVGLRDALPLASNLGELITVARRRFEAPAGTRYLELPVSVMVGSRSYAVFATHLLREARRFATVFNEELQRYRAATGTRSAAQPFPDLRIDADSVETPFWVLGDRRTTLWVRNEPDGLVLLGEGPPLGEVSRSGEPVDLPLPLAPKAVALTAFARLVLADLFVHGVGGGRYDRVTDGVIAGFFGVDAPAFATASMTMYLPLGGHIASQAEEAEILQKLGRLEHNPDTWLDDVDFDDDGERDRALALALEKTDLVAAIAATGSDKKALGARIREVNAELAAMLAPVANGLRARLDQLEAERRASEILTDRGYPFCLWSPLEIADKAR